MKANFKKFKIIILTFFLLFIYSGLLSSQTIQNQYLEFDSSYGMDARIYKGAKYFNEHNQDFGFQFLFQEESFIGSVVSKKFSLDSVELKYDIYKQFLVMNYYDQIGSKQQLTMNASEIQKFYLGEYCFIKNTHDAISSTYLQQIVDDSIKCYISYRKDYKLISNNTKKGFGYTDEIRQFYLSVGPNIFAFTNGNNLVKNLPEDIQEKVKYYLKENRINFRSAGYYQLTELFLYINSLPH